MSSQVASRRRARPGRHASVARRRRLFAIVLTALVAGVVLNLVPTLRHAAREIELPLRHEDIIRQQAAAKRLDPALVAAVIYAESKFEDGRTSPAGAQGLMQLTPQTARAIALRTGGVRFRPEDLGTPQVNISYGCWYLRYLLEHYGHDEAAALAAYNAGIGNVDRWMRAAKSSLTVSEIPFAETRAYVDKVLRARDEYRRRYRRELGL